MSDFNKCPDCNVIYTPIPPHVCNFKMSQTQAMSDTKPKEFWVLKSEMVNCPDGKTRLARVDDPTFEVKDPSKFVHVIEHSAYATAVAALKFYAQKPRPDTFSLFAKSAMEFGENVATWEPLIDLGEKARATLAALGEGEGEGM